MAKILIMMHPESSHFNSSLGLARRLIDAGHSITYLASPSDRAWCEKNRMPHALILQAALGSKATNQGPGALFSWWHRRQSVLRAFEELTADLDNAFAHLEPDFFIADALTPFAAFAGLANRVPTMLIQTMLPTTWDGDVPPIHTPMPPPVNPRDRARVAKLWRRQLRQKNFEHWMEGFNAAVRTMAGHYRFDMGKINWKDAFKFDLPIPKLILCSRAFDFPRPDDSTHHYLGACLHLERPEVEFPFDWLDSNRPLIYCATTTRRTQGDPVIWHQYQALLDAVARRGDLQLVLSTCGLEPSTQLNIPANAKVVKYSPQLALLKRAKLAIHHAGLNTIKECLNFGVPSLVFPGPDDQPGNAARLVYHRLGLMGRPGDIEPQKLGSLIDAVIQSDVIREGVAKMKAHFERDAGEDRALQIINEALSKKDQGSPVPARL